MKIMKQIQKIKISNYLRAFIFQFLKITNNEQIKENKQYSLQEAINVGAKKLSKQIEEEIPNKENIKKKNVTTKEEENGVLVTVIYEVVENIGKNQKIF